MKFLVFLTLLPLMAFASADNNSTQSIEELLKNGDPVAWAGFIFLLLPLFFAFARPDTIFGSIARDALKPLGILLGIVAVVVLAIGVSATAPSWFIWAFFLVVIAALLFGKL